MSNNEKYTIKEHSFDGMLDELNETSPLQMSKKLIEYELYDQQDSIAVLDQVYEEFEDGGDVIDGLVTPVFLNICDGLVKHPKLGLQKSGITATRLVGEIKNFSYDDVHKSKRDVIQDKANLDQNTDSNTRVRKYKRDDYEDKKRMKEYKDTYLKTKSRDEYTNKNKVKDKKPQPDHVVSLKSAVSEYGKSKFLSKKELKETLNKDFNFAVTNGSLNQSKGAQDNKDAVNNTGTIAGEQTEKTKQRMIDKEKESRKQVEGELNSTVGDNLLKDGKKVFHGKSKLVNQAKDQAIEDGKNKALGEVVILIIKPVYYEFSDIFKNGMVANLNVSDKIEAFIMRMKRVKDYVLKNCVGGVFDIIKDLLKNFVSMLINGIVNAFVGLLKRVLKVISEGFMSVVEAFKIMMKPSEELSSAQKADAITKLLATTVVTFLGAYFENSVLGFMDGTVLEPFKDIIMIMLTGIATTVVVWLLDQADIFSVKDEKRMMRVKEIFELRIEAIKKNTDIFEKASLETLAKQKLQFRKIADDMGQAIDNNLPVNDTVYQMADFMKIDLKVKSTDDFLELLKTNEKIVI